MTHPFPYDACIYPCAQDVKKHPMFCMETAVKLLTFSWVVYLETNSPVAEKDASMHSMPSASMKEHMVLQIEPSRSHKEVGGSLREKCFKRIHVHTLQ